MKIVIYGLTITSSWGNGHATTYRSLVKALARLGHTVLFVEKDVAWYREHRDLASPEFCDVLLYGEWQSDATRLVVASADADAVVIGSYFHDAPKLTRALLDAGRRPLLFYDIDTPITLALLRTQGSAEYLDADLIPHFDAYLSFTGGAALQELEDDFGSLLAVPFYCSVDPEIYRPSAPSEVFCCDLSYLGTYAADRQPKLATLLCGAAQVLPERRFLVAGPQYPETLQWPDNVRRIMHVPPPEHPAFYSSSRFTLNLTRADMVAAGYSPSVRLFEASACGAAIISDAWAGFADFLTPGEEVLLSRDAQETAAILKDLSEEERLRLGRRARERVLSAHTSDHRAIQFEQIVRRLG
jgi:spore maturation protein CgeB